MPWLSLISGIRAAWCLGALCLMASEIILWTEWHLVTGEIHFGEEEHSGRPAQLSRLGSSHGMVPSSEGVLGDLQCVRASPSQPLCHRSDHQASSVCVPSTGPVGLEAGCIPASVCLCHHMSGLKVYNLS